MGFPGEVTLDQGSRLQRSKFRRMLSTTSIKRKNAGIESYKAFGETERYQVYLRNIFEQVRLDRPNFSDAIALQLSLKECNVTIGSKGLMPTVLIFSVMPRLAVHSQELS